MASPIKQQAKKQKTKQTKKTSKNKIKWEKLLFRPAQKPQASNAERAKIQNRWSKIAENE